MMPARVRRTPLLLALLCLAPMALAAGSKPSDDSGKALAMRFADFATNIARTTRVDEFQARRVVALLQAAHQLDPDELRYLRLLADMLLQLKDTTAALDAENAIRRLSPRDSAAQLDTIDLYLARMETADKKLAYLRELLKRDAVAPEIRSSAALMCAGILEEQGRRDDASQLIDESIRLNPLNFAALQARLQRSGPTATPVQRVAMLVAMVRANPAQPRVLHLLGQQLAGAGMVPESVTWLHNAIMVTTLARAPLTPDLVADYGAANMLADRLDEARGALDQLLTVSPDNYLTLIMRSLIERRQDKPEAARDFRVKARNSLINRLNAVRTKLGITGATTRPIDQGEILMPEVAGDASAFAKAEKMLRNDYLQAIGDLAWFQVFLNDRPDEAQGLYRYLDSLSAEKQQAATQFLSRLEGWIYLKQGKTAEARVKLSAAAEADPMAALGLIRCLDAAQKDKARLEAQKLLNAYPSGFIGAILADNLRDLGVRPQPNADAPGMALALKSLPANWMSIIDRPQVFYTLRGQPVRISSAFGQPLLARFTIQNISDNDLSIGSDGVIKPGVWFDAQLGGLFQQNLPGVAIERITEATVLRPRQEITMIVRIDQGELWRLLQAQPTAPIGFDVVARTNPLLGPTGAVCGPAGLFIKLAKPFERSAFQVSDQSLQAAATAAATADPAERIRKIHLLTAIANQAAAATDNAGAKAIYAHLVDVLGRVREQSDPNVQAWALFAYAMAAPADQRAPAVQRMAGADQSWQTHMLALCAMDMLGLPADRQKQLAAQIVEGDKTKWVKDLADATVKEIDAPKPEPQKPVPAPR